MRRTSMPNISGLNHLRNNGGMSILELLVSTAVLGVAVVGATELVWMNTSWTKNFLNKTSASYSTQVFLRRLREDLDMAYRISDLSDSRNLIIWIPSSNIKANMSPFPPDVVPEDKVEYRVEADKITRTFKAEKWTVLRGLVGPKKIGNSDISVFQYVPKALEITDPNFGVKDFATGGVRSVIVDIEVLDRTYGKSKASETNNPVTSDITLRAEFIARNDLSLEP
jgi:hypothetical protein